MFSVTEYPPQFRLAEAARIRYQASMLLRVIVFCFIVSALLFSSGCYRRMEVVVRDQDGNPIENAQVRPYPGTYLLSDGRTDENGRVIAYESQDKGRGYFMYKPGYEARKFYFPYKINPDQPLFIEMTKDDEFQSKLVQPNP